MPHDPTWLRPTSGGGHPIRSFTGDVGAILNTCRELALWGERLSDGGDAVNKVNTEAWTGTAADAFVAKYKIVPKRWYESSDLVVAAARSLERYAYVLEWAQGEAKQARAEWDNGAELSRAGAAASGSPEAPIIWKKQEKAERLFGAQPKPTYVGDGGAARRAHALWRINNARWQHDATADEVARELNEMAGQLPIERNFLENLVEFFRGGVENVTGLVDAVADPGTTVAAFAEQGKLWFTDQKSAFDNLIDKQGYQDSEWRWKGALLLGGGVGKVGRVAHKAKPSYLPKGIKPGYYTHYRDSGVPVLPGKSGGDFVTQVRGEDLAVTPEIRELASRIVPERMDHIIERHGPDTPYPDLRTNMFPGNWTHDKVFSVAQEVVADPNSVWTRAFGDPAGAGFYRGDGKPATFIVEGFHGPTDDGQGLPVRVIVQPYGNGIFTAFRPNF